MPNSSCLFVLVETVSTCSSYIIVNHPTPSLISLWRRNLELINVINAVSSKHPRFDLNHLSTTCNHTTMNLPTEIQEKILKYLDGENLWHASHVCRLWKDLSKRLFWKLASRDISEDCLMEILGYDLEERGLNSCAWDEVYLAWCCCRISDPESPSVTHFSESHPLTCYCLTGNCLIVSDGNGVITLYSASSTNKSIVLANTGSSVWDLVVMDVARKGQYRLNMEDESMVSEHDFMVVMGPHYSHLYQINHLQDTQAKLIWSLDDLRSMSIAKTSIFGSSFAIAEIPTNLTIRKVKLIDKMASVDVESVITCHTWLWKWKLWKNKVLCILATGEIAVWNLTNEVWMSVSQRYSELLYQNPCVIFRGIVFCSSRTSQSLLEYWHCFPGDSYWLLCWDGEQFHKYYPKLIMGEDVTAVCVKRQMVAMGTASGKLCVYEHKASDSTIGKIWESSPIAVIQLADRAIRSLDLSFVSGSVTIAARTRKNSLITAQWMKQQQQL